MAWMGHLLILLGVSLILWVSFDDWGTGPSLLYFYVIEGVIVACAILATISTRQIVSVVDSTVVSMDGAEDWMYKNPKLKDRVQAGILLSIFALQFGSMAALVVATGGPIDSPFAPMALAIGIFTPFIVNEWWTVALIIVATGVFYVLIIAIMGFSGEESRPEPFAYAAVNLFILVLASIMTLKRRDSLSFTLRRMIRVSPERVWRAWTDQRQVARWLTSDGDREPEIYMDVREGGSWQVGMYRRDGSLGDLWSGKYLALEQPDRLVFSVDARSGMGAEVITVLLKKRGEHTTEMIVTQTDSGRFDGLQKGWSGFMDRIGWYLVSSRRDPPPSDGSDS